MEHVNQEVTVKYDPVVWANRIQLTLSVNQFKRLNKKL
jgi:hypothetical protein